MLSEKAKQTIIKLQSKYPEKRSALLPALHVAQAEIGYLPQKVQEEIAELFDLNVTEVHSVITFYDMYSEEPTGKHVLHVCKNISCMLRGSDEVIEKLRQKLNLAPGEKTTSDKQFTLIPSECLAACDKAPMMLANDKVVGPIEEKDLDTILEETKKMKGHPCPVPNIDIERGASH